MKWNLANEVKPESNNLVIGKTASGMPYLVRYVRNRQEQTDWDEDSGLPEFVEADSDKGCLWLKEGWYEDLEQFGGLYEWTTTQRKIVKWIPIPEETVDVSDNNSYFKVENF